MASILVILGSFAGLGCALAALLTGMGPLVALAYWMGGGLAGLSLALAGAALAPARNVERGRSHRSGRPASV
jgi:hypothetical protein